MTTTTFPDWTTKTTAESAGLPPLALIAGPTASGKSDLAVCLARSLASFRMPATVINADSAQVYADLQILSARPTEAEMQDVPHRLFGEWDGAQACSAADWAKQAQAVIAQVHRSGGVPILVGGTGLYLQTLLEGIAPIPAIDPAVRSAVRAMPVEAAHAELVRIDPDRASRLAPADSTRIARALEVALSTGRTLAAWQAQRSGGIGAAVTLHPAILLPDRARLYSRCDRRFAHMLAGGALGEVETLLARGLDPRLPVMRAIGVPQLGSYLTGRATLAEAEAAAQQATRNYAKRQMTWFRRQPPADWLRVESYDDNFILKFARLFLR